MPIPTLEQIEESGRNMDTITEFIDSTNNTLVDQYSSQRKTLKGIENEADNQLSQQQTDFDDQSNANQNTFEDQLSQQQTDFDNQQASAIAAAGYEIIGNFTDGSSLTKLSDAIYYAGDPLDNFANEGFYAWNGAFPKTVTAGSTPFDESGWQLAATGYTKQSGAIQLFGQVIDANISIPAGQNALSINPTISDDVTVTVPVGSEYVILGSTN
jgi:hypothetical protein